MSDKQIENLFPKLKEEQSFKILSNLNDVYGPFSTYRQYNIVYNTITVTTTLFPVIVIPMWIRYVCIRSPRRYAERRVLVKVHMARLTVLPDVLLPCGGYRMYSR